MKATVGPPFYQQVNGPLLLGLLVLMGAGPLLPWRKASREHLRRSFVTPLAIAGVLTLLLAILGLRAPAALIALAASIFAAATVGWEYYRGVRARMRSTGESAPRALTRLVGRARSRYGGYLVHLGVVLIGVGVICSSSFQLAREATLAPGGSMTIGRYTLTNQGLMEGRVDGGRSVTARVLVAESNGASRVITPAKIFYENFNDQPATHVAIETDDLEDLYVVLAGWADDGSISLATFVNPMVSLIWLGGLVLLFGTGVTLWPERVAAALPVAAPRRQMLGVEA